MHLLRISIHVSFQFVCAAALGGQEDAVLGQDAQAGAGVRDGLHGVLHLVQTALRREDRGAGIIAARL